MHRKLRLGYRYLFRLLDDSHGPSLQLRSKLEACLRCENMCPSRSMMHFVGKMCEDVLPTVNYAVLEVKMREKTDEHEEILLPDIAHCEAALPRQYIELYPRILKKNKVPFRVDVIFARFRAVCKRCNTNYEIWQRVSGILLQYDLIEPELLPESASTGWEMAGVPYRTQYGIYELV